MRRILKRLFPTWFASPLRRSIQAACLLLFLVLFFYVCYPYTARPAAVWTGWAPVEVDGGRGQAKLAGDQPPQPPIAAGSVVHVVDSSVTPPESFGPFRVTAAAGAEVSLEPTENIDAARLDRMSSSLGPWTLQARAPGSWPSHYAEDRETKEAIAAELFLAIDPLVSLSTAVASRTWVWSLSAAAVILGLSLVVPRAFCGYICPMGTIIDLFDWAISRRIRWAHLRRRGWWTGLKYYLLAAVLAAAVFGVLLSGFFAAIPVVTRGMAFLVAPLQTGLLRGWHQVPPMQPGQWVSIALFGLVLGLGLLGPRFWCKCLCPTGAVFSIGNWFRLTERRVAASCSQCGRCAEICPFDAIDDDFATRTSECTLCRTCGGVCGKEAVEYTLRLKPVETPAAETAGGGLGRRGFLSTATGLAVGAAGGVCAAAATRAFGARLDDPAAPRPVRPPGSVPEPQFLQLCIRCGECFRACPNDVLQPLGLAQGLEGLWTPVVAADWSGCESSCNHCGQVCPTGAIRALSLEEKRAARIGLAVVDTKTCLPFAGREACQVCVDECHRAGYHAIEFLRVGTQADAAGQPIEDTGFLAPVVLAEKCVGCGLCQTRCRAVQVKQNGRLEQAAIRIEAGEGREDRLLSGSYVSLREEEKRHRQPSPSASPAQNKREESYLPEFLH